ncbi:MAG: hypothetical protein K0S35_3916 [Geminicoccaceae bacterium]|nr:hypothetical protein [Geminicoccaceae bacterium]
MLKMFRPLCQDVLRVEDVQAFVFHGAEVEVGNRDDHEHVEIIFQTEAILVPLHRFLERGHGVLAFRDLVRLGVDLERNPAARGGGEAVRELAEPTGDQGEQIAGLGERVFPQREVTAPFELALADPIAVGEQHRTALPVGLDPHSVARHDVRPVGKVGDLAKAFGLALGAEVAARQIQALERGIALGVDADPGLEPAGVGQLMDGQMIVVDAVAVGAERLAVQLHPEQLELLAIEHQRRAGIGRRIAPQLQAGRDLAAVLTQTELELDPIHEPVRRPVVAEADRLGLTGCGGHRDVLHRA